MTFATITGKNIGGRFDLTNTGEINTAGTMYTRNEALQIEKADLTDWESVIVEIWSSNNDEIIETIIIK